MSSEISKITNVAKKYESSGNCGTVSTGYGDLGGISYGSYQLSSNAGSVESFVEFAKNYPKPELARYGMILDKYEVNSQNFINQWRELGNIDPYGFAELQDVYALEKYYNPACFALKDACYDVGSKSTAMKACVFSRAIQYGSGNVVELFTEGVNRFGYDNLSYVDDAQYDYDLIANIYDFLIEECDSVYKLNNGLYHSPKDWVNGSYSVIGGLRNRFVNEKSDLLAMF